MFAGLSAADALVMEWSEEEVLFLQEPSRRIFGGAISAAMRLILHLSMGLTIVRIGFEGFRMLRSDSTDKICEFAV